MTTNSKSGPELFLRDMRWLDRQVILHTDGILCSSTQEVVTSRAFERVFNLFIDYLEDHDDPLLESLVSGHRTGRESHSRRRTTILPKRQHTTHGRSFPG